MLTISAIWIVSLFLTDKKVSRVLVCSSIFYYLKKLIKETVLSFVQKMILNVQGHLIKAEKISIAMLVLVARAHQ